MRWSWAEVNYHNISQWEEKHSNPHRTSSNNHNWNKRSFLIKFKVTCKEELTRRKDDLQQQNLKIWFQSSVQGELQWAKSSQGSCHNFEGIQVMWWHHLKYSHSQSKHLCWHSHNSLRHHGCNQRYLFHHCKIRRQSQRECILQHNFPDGSICSQNMDV